MAYLKASFHSGVMYANRFSTTFGVIMEASKFWNPPTPALCIHSRSSLMPSFVMLPFIQCHQTRGLAPSGGFWKPLFSASVALCAKERDAVRFRHNARHRAARELRWWNIQHSFSDSKFDWLRSRWMVGLRRRKNGYVAWVRRSE